MDTNRARLYVSQYDDGSVLRFELASATLIDAIPTGAGASAMAASSDGAVLAVVNRLDQTLTLIDLDSGAVINTATVGRMPADVAALPGGGFAIANAFSDSITIVDERTGAVTAAIDGVASVPSAIAASSDRLAVASRAGSVIEYRIPGETMPERVIQLDSPATVLESLPTGGFVAATSDELLVIDTTGKITNRVTFSATHLDVAVDTIYAVGGSGIATFTIALQELSRSATAMPTAVAAGGGAMFVTDSGRIQQSGTFAAPAARATPVPQAPVVSSETLARTPQPEPVSDASPTETAVDPQKSAEQPQPDRSPPTEPSDQPIPPSVPIDQETRSSQPTTSVADPAITRPESPSAPARSRYHALRLGYVSQRPHAPYLGLGKDVEFQRQLRLSLETEGEHAGLLGLNWQRNPEPERFDSWIRQGATDTFTGDVEFHVDDAIVQTESMVRNADTGDINMSGGVSVALRDNLFRAENLQIRAPEDRSERELLAGIPIIPRGYKPPRRYAYAGYVDATDVEWREPYRDLTATTLEMTLDSQNVDADNVDGRAGGLFFHANELTMAGPDSTLAEQVWVSTCDANPPHYTLNFKEAHINDGVLYGRNARLEFWGIPTPLVIPRLRFDPDREDRRYRPDLEIGSSSVIGQYVNLGQWFSVSPYVDLGIRTMPTTRDGFGFGIDAEYDFREDPRTPLFRSEGSLRTLYTTEDRGYVDFRHQQDLTLRTRFVGQTQQWSDRDFLNDWFHDDFENQNGPRTFANFTHTRPGQIVTLTGSPHTHDFLFYTEKLPEVTYHLLDRQIAKNLYLSWDSFAGYYELDPANVSTERAVNIARLSYDIQLGRALNVLPFVEGDYSVYEDRLVDEDGEERFGVTGGVTFQSRLQRTMPGIGPYQRLKHIVIPSVTYIYRPDPSGDPSKIPQLDGLDFRPGRERVEGKIENVLLAKHAETGDVWQLAHLAIYAGSDFESEIGTSDDFEVDFSFRPVPKWGLFASAEHHDAEAGGGVPGGEYNRALTYVFYDNQFQSNTFNARLGYSYSDLDRPLDQRELLYGAGIRMGKKWSFGFEHRLELDNNEITRQTYEVRRLLHDWELAVRIRDREEGVDASVSFTLIDFPTASLQF